MDRVDLYKSKTRSTADKTPQDKKTVKQNGAVPEPVKTLSTREKREKFKNFQEKLKVSDVVKSVLGNESVVDCLICKTKLYLEQTLSCQIYMNLCLLLKPGDNYLGMQ